MSQMFKDRNGFEFNVCSNMYGFNGINFLMSELDKNIIPSIDTHSFFRKTLEIEWSDFFSICYYAFINTDLEPSDPRCGLLAIGKLLLSKSCVINIEKLTFKKEHLAPGDEDSQDEFQFELSKEKSTFIFAWKLNQKNIAKLDANGSTVTSFKACIPIEILGLLMLKAISIDELEFDPSASKTLRTLITSLKPTNGYNKGGIRLHKEATFT
jgi:hypothetical protein